MSSPIEPYSPTSMEYSPISPTRIRILPSLPGAPTLEPPLYLPRLVTAFQSTRSNSDSARRSSLTFDLPTPSPLSLGESSTSASAKSMQSPLQYSAVMHEDSISSSSTTSISNSSSSSGSSPDGHVHSSTPQSPMTNRGIPALLRQNANEGLEELMHTSSPVDSMETTTVSATASATIPTTLLTPRPRSRSPISKSRNTQNKLTPPRSKSILTLLSKHHHRTTLHRIATNFTPPPSLHIPSNSTSTSDNTPSLSPRSLHRASDLRARLTHLSRPLVPLVSVTTGQPHPSFPTSLLAYQLLTHEQLDDLARWYHQTGESGRDGVRGVSVVCEDGPRRAARWMYPCAIGWGKVWVGKDGDGDSEVDGEGDEGEVVEIDLATKRRRWGRFIGLRGCESPIEVVEDEDESEEEEGDDEAEEGERKKAKKESLEKRMETEWHEAIRRAREKDALREKMGRGWC